MQESVGSHDGATLVAYRCLSPISSYIKPASDLMMYAANSHYMVDQGNVIEGHEHYSLSLQHGISDVDVLDTSAVCMQVAVGHAQRIRVLEHWLPFAECDHCMAAYSG